MNYASVAQVRGLYLYGLVTDRLRKLAGGNLDGLIETILDTTKVMVDDYLGQKMDRNTRTLRLDGGPEVQSIPLPNLPIYRVTSCKILLGFSQVLYEFAAIKHTASEMLGLPKDDGNADLMVVRDEGVMQWVIDNFTIAFSNAPMMRRGVFDTGRYMVETTYEYGFTTVPIEIQNAHAALAAVCLAELSAGAQFQGATSIKIGSVQRTWANKQYEPLLSYWLNAMIPSLLRQYRIKSWKA